MFEEDPWFEYVCDTVWMMLGLRPEVLSDGLIMFGRDLNSARSFFVFPSERYIDWRHYYADSDLVDCMTHLRAIGVKVL